MIVLVPAAVASIIFGLLMFKRVVARNLKYTFGSVDSASPENPLRESRTHENPLFNSKSTVTIN